mgnify:FL=1
MAHGQVCGLGSGLDIYCSGECTKAAIAVRKEVCDAVLRGEWSNECLCVIHVTISGQYLLLSSSYWQYGDDIEMDIYNLRRDVQGAVPFLVGLDANTISLAWHSKNLQAATERDFRGDVLSDYIVESELIVLNEESEFFAFAGPTGSSDIDVTLGNAFLE